MWVDDGALVLWVELSPHKPGVIGNFNDLNQFGIWMGSCWHHTCIDELCAVCLVEFVTVAAPFLCALAWHVLALSERACG